MDIVRKKPNKTAVPIKALLICGVAGLLVWAATSASNISRQVSAESVLTDVVTRGDFNIDVRGIGTLVPKEVHFVATEVSGRVDKIMVKAGAKVMQGDTLVRLTNAALKQQLEESQWELEETQAQLNAQLVSLESQVLDQETLVINSQLNYERTLLTLNAQETLLNQGIVVASGNDACVAMAEHIAGSESAFADLMNAHAEQLGMSSSFFENSHGLHSSEHFTTPRDMATLAIALIRDVPEEYAVYKQKSFTYNNIKQYNRNSLLWDKNMNVDGLKTGHTSQAGYSLVTSATKGGMRLVTVVMGTESERARAVESKKLLNYGFRFFETFTPYKAGEKFVSDRVWMGDAKEVDLGILVDTPITIPRGQRKNLEANFKLDRQLTAPLAKGEVVGKLFLQLDGEDIAEYPLVTLQEINEGGMFSRLLDYIKLQFAN